MPWLDDLVFVERIVPRLVAATCVLPVAEQAKLAKFWCENSCENTLRRILHCLQEAVTFQLISTEYDATFQDENAVTSATKTMKVKQICLVLMAIAFKHLKIKIILKFITHRGELFNFYTLHLL